jgi:hypothetical protein
LNELRNINLPISTVCHLFGAWSWVIRSGFANTRTGTGEGVGLLCDEAFGEFFCKLVCVFGVEVGGGLVECFAESSEHL